MKKLFYKAASSGFIAIACQAPVTQAKANVAYDLDHAVISYSPAGQLATNVSFGAPTFGSLITMRTTTAQAGPGCEYSGCADSINGATQATEDGSLHFDMEDTPLGDVKGMVGYSGGRYVEVDRKAYVTGHGEGHGSFYTALMDPARTSFSFTFFGHSAAAGQGVTVNLGLTNLSNWSDVLFSHTVTGNEAGNWQLVIDTPLGMDLMGKNLYFNISAASGANKISSFAVTPYLHAIPEPGTWALTGLGLVGLAWMRRHTWPDSCSDDAK